VIRETTVAALKTRHLKNLLYLRRNSDRCQLGTTIESIGIDGLQRGRQEYFSQERIEIESVLRMRRAVRGTNLFLRFGLTG
jgi:hypothetical protein